MAFATSWAPQQKGIVLDGFAGPGGWSEGIRRFLGLHDVGLEWDRSACETRAAAGHTTIRVDVSSFVLTPIVGRVWGLLMSPPCTKFSAAGKGLGRRVLDLLASGIQRMMRGDDCRQELRDRIYPIALAAQEESNAKRKPDKQWSSVRVVAAAQEDAFLTVLVLEPARYLYTLINKATPGVGIPLEWAAFEQVPSVLPLWQVYARELRRLGWFVWTGVLNAADYGVPQTRERAFLLASAVHAVSPPAPTHSRLAEPEGLFGESLPKWVTMAEALGWGATDQPVPTVTAGGGKSGGAEPFPTRAREALINAQERGAWVLRNGTQKNAAYRELDEPAGTLFFGGRCNDVSWVRTVEDTAPEAEDSVRITQPEAAILQSFPGDYPWQGTKTKQFEQIGNAVPALLAAHGVSAVTGIPVNLRARDLATAA